MREGYRPIGDYAVLGDGHAAALVASDGSIDWCCWPRFDSDAVFCRLLDCHRGGWFQVRPSGEFQSDRDYVADTNILETAFRSDGSRFRLTDFMPIEQTGGSRRILRCIEGLSGTSSVDAGIRPTFEFAQTPTEVTVHERGIVARYGNDLLSLVCPATFTLDGNGAARATLRVRPGERVWLALVYRGDPESALTAAEQAENDLKSTQDYWHRWSRASTYRGPYEKLVRRSALALKMLIYSPTGAMVAAPTTSLPERIGGGRNWDYRYAWLRDSTLTVDALATLGYHDEALGFFGWLEGLDLESRNDLQIMYTVCGKADLPERILEGFEGYRGSGPVRIGNAASQEVQLDVYGEVIGAAHACFDHINRKFREETWRMLCALAGRAAARWRENDRSIWENRGQPQPFLYSKLRCWVAVDRALRLADGLGLSGDLSGWRKAREEIREAILTQGFNEEIGAFTQAFGSKELDASALTMAHVGFLSADDYRLRSTTARIRERLTDRGLVRRYLCDDGLGTEGAFTLCSFWLVDNLAMQGQLEEAHRLFESVTRFANDVGLLSEEIDPETGDLLGNFPQGLAHLGLIRSATVLERAEASARKKEHYGKDRVRHTD